MKSYLSERKVFNDAYYLAPSSGRNIYDITVKHLNH